MVEMMCFYDSFRREKTSEKLENGTEKRRNTVKKMVKEKRRSSFPRFSLGNFRILPHKIPPILVGLGQGQAYKRQQGLCGNATYEILHRRFSHHNNSEQTPRAANQQEAQRKEEATRRGGEQKR